MWQRLIQYAFAFRDDHRDQYLPGDIDGCAAHVEDRIYRKQQSGAFQR